jgi:RNA polymerase sigma-70 factor (ECF subfamily)
LDADARLAALVARVATVRDQSAFAEFFRLYAPQCHGFYVARGASPEAAEELAHDAMLAVWNGAGRYSPARNGSVCAWLRGILRDHWFRVHGRPDIREAPKRPIDPDLLVCHGPDDEPEHGNRRQRFRDAFRALPAQQRDLLLDVFHLGRSQSAIARERQMPIGTVKSHIRRGLLWLRGEVGAEE